MLQSPPVTTEILPFYRQFCGDLTEARTFPEGVDIILRALQHCAAPTQAQIVWQRYGAWHVVGGQSDTAIIPDERSLKALRRGETVVRGHVAKGITTFLPLRARGELAGWFFLQRAAHALDGEAILPLLAEQAGPVLSMLATVSERDEHQAQLETLTSVSQQISGVLDFDRLLGIIHQMASRVVEAPYFSIKLNDAAQDCLVLALLVVNGEYLAAGAGLPNNVGLSNVVLRQRAPLATSDYAYECQRLGVQPSSSIGIPEVHSWLGVPLIARDQVIGVLSVGSDEAGYEYSPNQIALLSAIAAQAAVAIENARLYRRSTRQAFQMSTLNRIGRTITSWQDPERVPSVIMDQITHLLNVEEGSLILFDEQSNDLVFTYMTGPVGQTLQGQHISTQSGLAGYVFTSGESIIANDVQQDQRFDSSTDESTGYTTRRMLAVALRGVGGSQGVIEVMNRRDNSPFTDEDRRLLEAVADYAVIALDNARRYAQVDEALARRAQELARINDQLQHNLRSLTALNGLGMAIQTALRSPDDIYRMTATGVVELSNALGAWVLLHDGQAWRQTLSIGIPVQGVAPFQSFLTTLQRTGRPELLDSGLADALTDAGARWLLAVPLRATDRVAGCLCVAYADEPDPSDRETVMLFAMQAASAVESKSLFEAVRSARDQMASILASTREGVLLVGADRRIALANDRLNELCALEREHTRPGVALAAFLERWEQQSPMTADAWALLRVGIDRAFNQREVFVSGELSDPGSRVTLEWSVLAALSSGYSQGGVLIVMRDISDAKESEKLRQDLTNMIVHDLRSPLSSVMASIDMMTRGVTGSLNAGQRHVLKIANESSEHMLGMINTLLDISRLESGGLPLSLAPVDIASTANRAIEQLHSLAVERGVRLDLECANDLPTAHADEQLIVRVVQNLVANALKFSARATRVVVKIAVADDEGAVSGQWLRVSVADQGIGIAPQDLAKIFTKFSQVGERRGGTGLGLTFCKLVVEAHKGRMLVESAVNEGSIFSFTLPASSAAVV